MLNNDSQMNEELENLIMQDKLSKIKNKIVVLSGKGGVGKSTVAVNIAISMALNGFKTGLLDIDIHGPSIPTLLGLEGKKLQGTDKEMIPIEYGENLKVISIGFLINTLDTAIIWRGPMKMAVIKQFIRDAAWEDLDYLIVDCPPGTGDEPLSIIQLLENVTGIVIVTTPQKLAIADVRKSIDFCEKLEVPIIGVIENMSGFICPECNKVINIFSSGGGRGMSKDMKVPFLGEIPIDPAIVEAGDAGKPFIYLYSDSHASRVMQNIIKSIIEFSSPIEKEKINGKMKFAIPTAQGKLCSHFGHCEYFTFIEIDESSKAIIRKETKIAPEHSPGILPPWIVEQGANIILAGGMGLKAQEIFNQHGVKVITGSPSEEPEKVVFEYLNGTLVVGANICDH